jgi:hypothetical protein
MFDPGLVRQSAGDCMECFYAFRLYSRRTRRRVLATLGPLYRSNSKLTTNSISLRSLEKDFFQPLLHSRLLAKTVCQGCGVEPQ